MNKLLLAPALFALGLTAQDVAPAPGDCPVCHDQDAVKQRLGVESHGGFRFGYSDTHLIDRVFEDEFAIHWIEGEHIKLGIADVAFQSGQAHGADTIAATGALAMAPFARVHEYLKRCEALFDQFLEIVELGDADFPTVDVNGTVIPSAAASEYRGKGPHLGQAGKFEVLILPGQAELDRYLRHANGLRRATSNRVFVRETDAQQLVLHFNGGLMWADMAIYSNVAHGLAHNFLRGLEHDDYFVFPWLEIGLAHSFERDISHTDNSFCSNAEAFTHAYELGDWNGAIKAQLRERKAPYLERLLKLEHERDFALADHLLAWSLTRFLLEEHPKAYGGILRDIKGITAGKPSIGIEQLHTAHRDAFAKHMDMTYDEFDKAWAKWAKKQRKERQ